jgi:hypothetical protein
MSSKDIVLYNTDLLFLITDYLDDKSSNNLFMIDKHHNKMINNNNSHRYTKKHTTISLDEYMDIDNLEYYRDYFYIKKMAEYKNATIDVTCSINFLIDYDNTIYYEEETIDPNDYYVIPANWDELIILHGSMIEFFSSIFPERKINIIFKDEYNKKFICSSHQESATVNIIIYINNYHYEEH